MRWSKFWQMVWIYKIVGKNAINGDCDSFAKILVVFLQLKVFLTQIAEQTFNEANSADAKTFHQLLKKLKVDPQPLGLKSPIKK